ncbi:hypothetical protein GC176_13000 [bacterium]|nr:hypothetical protein [bacterium]
MPDPRDYLTLCRLGVPGLSLLVLGLAGVMIQKSALRRALSFAVLITGALALFDAAARFHRLAPAPTRSMTLLTITLAPLVFTVARSLTATKPASFDSENASVSNGNQQIGSEIDH